MMRSNETSFHRLLRRAGALLLILSTGAAASAFEGLPFRPEVTLSTATTKMEEPVSVAVVEPAEAKQLFTDLSRLQGVPYNYPDEGCYARAHAMALELEKRGLWSVKVFVMGDLEIQAGKKTVDWRYHVAPALAVSDGAPNFHLEVFDPSMFDHSVRVEEWVYEQTRRKNRPFRVYYATQYTYAPFSSGPGTPLYLVMQHQWDAEDLAAKDRALATYTRKAQQQASGVVSTQDFDQMLWWRPTTGTFTGWPEVKQQRPD